MEDRAERVAGSGCEHDVHVITGDEVFVEFVARAGEVLEGAFNDCVRFGKSEEALAVAGVEPVLESAGKAIDVVGANGGVPRFGVAREPRIFLGLPLAKFVGRQSVGGAKGREIHDTLLAPVGKIAGNVIDFAARIEEMVIRIRWSEKRHGDQ